MARTSKRKHSSSTSKSRSSAKSSRDWSAAPIYNDVIAFAGSLLRNRQETGAEKIGSVAEATRHLAGEFEDTPNIQTYINAAAEQMDVLAEYVADTRLEDMVEDAGILAKRNPVATAALAVAAGFASIYVFARRSSLGDGSRSKSRRTSSRSVAAGRRAVPRSKAKANGRDSSNAAANAS